MNKKHLIICFAFLVLSSSCTDQRWTQLTNSSSLSEMGYLSNSIGNTVWVMPTSAEYIYRVSGMSVSPPEFTSFNNSMIRGAICITKSYVYLIYNSNEVKRYSPAENSWESFPEFKNEGGGGLRCAVSDDLKTIAFWSDQWFAYTSEKDFVITKNPLKSDIDSLFFTSNNEIYLVMTTGEVINFFNQWEVLYIPETGTVRKFLGITSKNTIWFAEDARIIKIDLDAASLTESLALTFDIAKIGSPDSIIEVDNGEIWLFTSEAIVTLNAQGQKIWVLPKKYGNILFMTSAEDYVYMSTTEGVYALKK